MRGVAGHHQQVGPGGVETAGQIGVIARLHQVQRRGVGLGLGGEIGAGHGLDPFSGPGLALGGLFQTGQGGAAEFDHVAAVRLQPDLF